MTVELLEQPGNQLIKEKLVILQGISWQQFKAIAAQLQDHRDVKLSYLHGALEIMSPIGEQHEQAKSTLGLLLETYLREKTSGFINEVVLRWRQKGMHREPPTSLIASINVKRLPILSSR